MNAPIAAQPSPSLEALRTSQRPDLAARVLQRMVQPPDQSWPESGGLRPTHGVSQSLTLSENLDHIVMGPPDFRVSMTFISSATEASVALQLTQRDPHEVALPRIYMLIVHSSKGMMVWNGIPAKQNDLYLKAVVRAIASRSVAPIDDLCKDLEAQERSANPFASRQGGHLMRLNDHDIARLQAEQEMVAGGLSCVRELSRTSAKSERPADQSAAE